MDTFDAELARAAKALETVPRRLSLANVKLLGVANHFETFEDELRSDPNANALTRLSLSGSIVVIDLDFSTPQQIAGVSLSLSQETQVNERSTFAKTNGAEQRLLASLREPRLDRFASLLGFLSRCDRLSTKDVNCFHALDVVGEAVRVHVEKTGTRAFGALTLNPPGRIGLGLNYHRDLWAMIDAASGTRDQFGLRGCADSNAWVDAETGEWRDVPVASGVRAELVISLDPPALLPLTLARELRAVIADAQPALDARTLAASFSVDRHPRFATPTARADEFGVVFGNMLAESLVAVEQVPLAHPRDIPRVLAPLQQYARVAELVRSVLRGPPRADDEPADISVADALALAEHGVARARVPLSVSIYTPREGTSVIVDATHGLSERRLRATIGADVAASAYPAPPAHGAEDIQLLVENGRLDLAVSYFLSTHGALRRASSRA